MPIEIKKYLCEICKKSFYTWGECYDHEQECDKCKHCKNAYYVYGCEFDCKHLKECKYPKWTFFEKKEESD